MKFKCHVCGHDKYIFSMTERSEFNTRPRKTFPSHIDFAMFNSSKNIHHTRFSATCPVCGAFTFTEDSLADLQRRLIDKGALK